jgi:triacylglycerol esterase/lipase EstA (alpha/beta hydrolase family)
VVFVHGLGGDAVATWRRGKDNASSWPHWLGQDFPNVGVWSLGYAASPTKWARLVGRFSERSRDAGHGMALPDRALEVLDLMVQRGLGERPLFFICHSLGGLLAKEILRASSDDIGRLKHVFVNTRAVLFLATPHAGAALASLVSQFRTVFGATVTIGNLQAHDASCGFRAKWGTDSGERWGAITTQVGRGFDGKWGTFRPLVVMVPHVFRNGAPSVS